MAIKIKSKKATKKEVLKEAIDTGKVEIVEVKEAPKVEEPKTHANVSKKVGREKPVHIKGEEPLDPTVKKNLDKNHNPKTVGMALGITKNMDNYESLRIDVWCTDVVRENETEEQALERIGNLVRARIDAEVEEIVGE